MRRALFPICVMLAGCGEEETATPAPALPSEPVEILVDRSGIPHVYAKNDRDAFWGQGYRMATDRLLQLDMIRRRALGRWAEVLPEHAEDDELARLFDWRGLGRAVAKVTREQNPEEWGLVTAWVAGVNARIGEVLSGAAPLPAGFEALDHRPEPWDEADPLVVAKMIGFGNDLSLEFEIFATIADKLAPDAFDAIELVRPAREAWSVPPEDLPKIAASWHPPLPRRASAPPPDVSSGDLARALGWLGRLGSLRVLGSNNWAIDGRHTDSGRPLIAGDPHLGYRFPGILYGVHLNSADAGGAFDVAGFSLPATPGVSLGHNAHVAWAATTAFGDVMDVWQVPFDGERVTIGDESVAVVSRVETIAVRGSDPVEIHVLEVPGHGVLLPSDIAPIAVADPGHELLFRWTGFDVSRPLRLTGINRARDVEELEAAIDQQSGMNFNMVVADASSIALRVGLDVPKRTVIPGNEPWLVMDGTDARTLWTGEMLARELLPHGRAAVRGWIATANTDPFGFTANGRLDDDPWYFGALFAPGWRAGRAQSEIAALVERGGVGVEDMKALQLDLHDNLADDLLPVLEQAWAAAASDPELGALAQAEGAAELYALLSGWDRRMTRGSNGAVAFHAFSHLLAAEVLRDDLTLLFYPAFDLNAVFLLKVAMLTLTGAYPNGTSLLQGGRDRVVLTALGTTAKWLIDRFGSVGGGTLGDVHVASFLDSLGAGVDFGSFATDGGEATVNVAPSHFFDGSDVAERWTNDYGPVVRMVMWFDDAGTPVLEYTQPLGNVGDPDSPLLEPMTEAWRDGEHRRMPFLRAEIEADLAERIEIPAAR